MQSRQDLLKTFDPNGVGLAAAGIFGLPFDVEQAQLVLIPMPWDVTVSYGHGTAAGPAAILQASPQLDLYDPDIQRAWELGIAMAPIDTKLAARSKQLRAPAKKLISELEAGNDPRASHAALYQEINKAGARMALDLHEQAQELLDRGKIVGVVGGDHSTPLGLMRAMGGKYKSFGMLQIDAHADLREAYEGFRYSHASIMYNALQISGLTHLTQVGIRDLCAAEATLAAEDSRITMFSDADIRRGQFEGQSWAAQTQAIIATLPQNVYVSFDIDGLEPALCPHTGTPVPGGLQFAEASYLLEQLVRSGRRIIGFDLVEVAPNPQNEADEWDANVGARILYRMANLCALSQGLLEWSSD